MLDLVGLATSHEAMPTLMALSSILGNQKSSWDIDLEANKHAPECAKDYGLSASKQDAKDEYMVGDEGWEAQPAPRTDGEMFWVRHQRFLRTKGYELRPRYHPDWVPMRSHLNGMEWGFTYEDEYVCQVAAQGVLDAVHIVTKRKVAIKVVMKNSQELRMALAFSHPSILADPCNHCFPVLDHFPVPGQEDVKDFMVMPYLQRFCHPKFHCRKEVGEALLQILECLTYFHERNIAHGDSCTLNFMMDATEVCPKGSHFNLPHCSDDGYTLLKVVPRCRTSKPVRYYIIDYEGMRYYPEGIHNARATDMRCQIKSSPEFNEPEGTEFNPFPLDVYNVGASFLKLLDQKDSLAHLGIDDFEPLLLSMTAPNPLNRPTAAQALSNLRDFLQRPDKDELWMAGRVWGAHEQDVDTRPPLVMRFLHYQLPWTTLWEYY